MAIQIDDIIEILQANEIFPTERTEVELPEVGKIKDGEIVYRTSIGEVLHEKGEREQGILDLDNPRIYDWWGEIEQIIETARSQGGILVGRRPEREEPPEPRCAWYCPIHFYGHRWGIYMRENCILAQARDIALSVNWGLVRSTPHSIARQLLRSAFYVFFLHEQFHHKIESLGFRLLITTGSDRYRPYKAQVYRKYYMTPDCLEESLANAESYLRLGEAHYSRRLEKPIRDGLKDFLWASIPMQPPGYSEGVNFLSAASFRYGLYKLQSQILYGTLTPTIPIEHWAIAPNMITALKDITDEIYIIIPQGSRPIFRSQ